MALWVLFAAVLSVVAVDQSVGTNPLTCITFDMARYGKFTSTNHVWLDIRGVSADPNGVANKGGRFGLNSRLKIPFFWGNSFNKLSISLWFKKKAEFPYSCMMILSTGQCEESSIVISSISDVELKVKVKTGVDEYARLVPTLSQTAFNHVAVTFSANPANGNGRLRIYVNGDLKEELPTRGKIQSLDGPMIVGSDSCGGDSDFLGSMDSVSFARAELSASEVAMVHSRGRCIGG